MVWTQPDFGKLTQQKLNSAKLGTIDAFKAPVGTAYDADNAWRYLGRAKAGSFKNDLSRKFYDLMTGVPETAKESFVIGVEGKIEIVLIEPTSDVYNLAAGNEARTALFGTVPVTDAVGAAPAVDTIPVADSSVFAVGDEIEINNAAGKMYTFVTAIPDATHIDVYPKLSTVPTVADAIKRVDGWELGMGGTNIELFSLRFVAHFTDGSQIVTWAKQARADGVKDDFADGKKEMEIPLNFTLFGYTDAAYTGPIVAKKYLLTPAMALSFD